MNIVFFMQDTGAVFGAERATLDLARGLRQAGDAPVFLLLAESRMADQQSALRAAIEDAGFPVRLIPISGRLSIKAARRVHAEFHELQGDILHVIGYKANLHARLSGVRPVAATVHGWLFRRDLKERLYDAVDRWCLRRCDSVICLSTYYRDLLLKYAVRDDRLSLIPSGLDAWPDVEACAPDTLGNRSVVIGMMGRFSEEKNHAMFLAAAAEVHRSNPDVRFRIAGKGPLEDRLKRRCSELGIEEVVDFCGYMDVADFMTSIDVYVICSNIENLPYSILEAMAWCRPVIGTRVGGIPDLVEDGKTGYLVARDDRGALARSIVSLIEAPERITSLGRNGRSRLVELFTLEKSVEQHQHVYRSLAERNVST